MWTNFEEKSHFCVVFFVGKLEHLDLALDLDVAIFGHEKKRVHDPILFKAFAHPKRNTPNEILYEFSWGILTSTRDPRGEQAEIVVRWR